MAPGRPDSLRVPDDSLRLRPASAADAARVATLLIDSRRAFMPYAPSAHPEHELRAWVAQQLVPGGGVVLLEDNGQVLGLMALETGAGPAGQTAWITQMAVDPARVNGGLGTRLLMHALRTLPRPIRLYTFQANHGARRFYERHGFRAIRFTDGQDNEEHCPDVLYECTAAWPDPGPGSARGDAPFDA